jgi:membrane protein implicated in regulation of membrane protease activity
MTWWLWLLLGLILAALEMVSSGGFYLIFFGVAAMFVGVMALIGLAGPPWLQWVVFALLSVVMLLVFRRPILRMVQVETTQVDSLVGEIAVVVDHVIAPGAVGRAELRGSNWSARNLHTADLLHGQRCRVERVDGLMIFLLPEA